jgi:ABC-type multidrug transport system ATPase subunit
LDKLEYEMRRIITSDELSNTIQQQEPERSIFISELWRSFNKLIGVNNRDDEFDPDQTVKNVLEYVKKILGITELEILRRGMISKAISILNDK